MTRYLAPILALIIVLSSGGSAVAQNGAVQAAAPASSRIVPPTELKQRPPSSTAAQVVFASGMAKYRVREYDAAIADFDRALAIDPGYIQAYNIQGLAKRAKGDLDGALANFERVIEINPRYLQAYLNRGSTKMAKGNVDGAIADYDRAIEIAPRDPANYLARATAKQRKGDLDGAIADYDRAIEITPQFTAAINGRAAAMRAKGNVSLIKDNQVPNRTGQNILVLSADWVGQIPATGRVNAPEFLNALYPGQKIALALMVEGPDPDKLLNGLKISVRFSSPTKGAMEQRDLNPVAARRIKAKGADMAMRMLHAGGIAPKDRASHEAATSLATLAVFQPDWAAPLADQPEEIQISATISGSPEANTLDPVGIKLRLAADWLSEPSPTMKEINQFLNRYHEDLPPGRLLSLLKAAADNGGLKFPSVFAFFAIAYKENLAARNAALAMFPSLDPKTQWALTFVLRLGGQDISGLLSAFPAETVASLKTVEPLKDPRDLPHFQDPVAPEATSIGVALDQCWGGWIATGEQSYLRALVGLLAGAPDLPALQSWTKNKGGAKGLNASVARGLAYQIAGWSIGSFQRTDPHVADWLLFWENDPAMPPLLRNEIASLPTNPAFRRK